MSLPNPPENPFDYIMDFPQEGWLTCVKCDFTFHVRDGHVEYHRFKGWQRYSNGKIALMSGQEGEQSEALKVSCPCCDFEWLIRTSDYEKTS